MGDSTPKLVPAGRRSRSDRVVQVVAGLILFLVLIALIAFGLWWKSLGPLDLSS